MTAYLVFGTRRDDFGLMIDFHKHRAIVRTNTDFIEGTPLETIPPGLTGYKRGMVLIHRDWKTLYFMVERQGWTEDDYFKLAKQKFEELGIKKP